MNRYDKILKQNNYHGVEEIPYKPQPYKPQYDSEDEKHYREWCLTNCLFINPLNDITTTPVAGQDILQFPSYVTEFVQDGPYLPAAFSAIKRKYSYARFLLFEGLFNVNCPAYEIKNLYLTDLNDGNFYALATEKIKTAFRLVFSVFDSLAALLFNYFLQKNPRKARVKFNGKWLWENFSTFNNPFIKSLYWIACDLTDVNQNNPKRKAANPDARKLRQIRNALEHGWLRVSNGITSWDNKSETYYAYTITEQELKEVVIRTFQLARSCIITSTFAVKYKEREKTKAKTITNGKIVPEMVPVWEP